MEKIKNEIIKETAYVEKLDCGLKVIIIPKKDVSKKYIIFATKFGSIDNRFIMPQTGEEVFIPDGVAHFLEHKMFEQSNGTNSLDVLMAMGIEANAYTTSDHTAYLFECTDNFYEGLDELMDYVQNPYFTDENVEKEKGIIGQEINMYDDDPNFQVYINAMQCLYKNNPVRIDIAGTVKSISEITPDVLNKCYKVFYNLDNMTMVVCGDFEPETILQEIKKRLKAGSKTEKDGEIKRIYPEEPKEINKNEIDVKMEVSTPLFMIGFKDYEAIGQNKKSAIEMVKRHIAIEIILNALIGNGSKLYKELYDEGLLLSEPELDYEFSDEYAHVLIGGQTKQVDTIYTKLKQEIEEVKKNGISEDDFERIKRKIYGQYAIEYNNVSDIARMFLADEIKGIWSFDYINECLNIKNEYVQDILKTVFKPENMIVSSVSPQS